MADAMTGDGDSVQGTSAAVFLAWIEADGATARRLADALAEGLDTAVAVAACEDGPRWRVEIQFDGPPDEAGTRDALARVVGAAAAAAFRFETVAARDWVAASLAGLPPVEAGRFVVHGAHDRARVAANRIAIEIEAGLAFGTGHHAATRGCLLAIDRLLKAKRNRPRKLRPGARRRRFAILDVGTGSGVLAIATAKAMRRYALASDIDPVAVRIARDNARRNGVGGYLETTHAAGLTAGVFRQRGSYPLIVANILLEPLKRLAAAIARLAQPGTHVVLSGLLASQGAAALAVYRSCGLALAGRITLDGWTTLVLARRRSGGALSKRSGLTVGAGP